MEIDITSIASVATITVICMLIAQGVKQTKLDHKWLPFICGVCGAVLGVFGYFAVEGFPAGDILTALAVGIVSGLAGTGAHQTFKQLYGGTAAKSESGETEKTE